MRKIMKALKDEDNEFIISFIQDRKEGIILGCCGDSDTGFLICLNTVDIIIPTLVHELIHAAYPEKSETQVCRYTNKVVAKLTRRQRKALFVKWAERISEYYEESIKTST